MAAALMLSTAVIVVNVSHNDVDAFETTIIGFGSYDDYMVDLTPENLEEHDLVPGDILKLIFPDKTNCNVHYELCRYCHAHNIPQLCNRS